MSASLDSRMDGQNDRETDAHTAITTVHSTEHRSCRSVINSNAMTELRTELSEEPTGGTWREYGEHPLTAATTAMLNIHSSEEQQHVTLLYEYYKPDGSGVGSPVVGGALDCKMTNGVSEGVSGAAPVEGLLFVGGAEGVKREPEDLTRRAVSPADRGALCDKRRSLLPPLPPPPSESPPPALDTAPALKDELEHHVIKEELEHHGLKVESGDRPRANHTLVIQAPLDSADKMSAGSYIGGFSAASPQSNYEHVSPYLSPSPQPYSTSTSPAVRGSPAVYTVTENYYRDYYPSSEPQYTVRQEYTADPGFVDRYLRPPYKTNGVSSTLTVDLPSPADSGISADAVTPRDQPVITQTFGYDEMVQPGSILGTDLRAPAGTSPNSQRASRPWHDFARHTEGDKIQIPKIHTDDDKIHIPKIFNQYGFKYHLETPISTSQRREDDRITYINKGQFYGITMEYIPDPEKPLKSGTVKSVVMLMFREEKTPEDEIKAWQFWHSRQHSVKQRILDVDTKNSVGLVGCIEEIAHNAIVVYWNPLETGAKISVAIQCLSTDFSSQKGVKGPPLHIQVDTYAVFTTPPQHHHYYPSSRTTTTTTTTTSTTQPLPLHTQGLPLHIQVDTYEDPRDAATLVHRGYCQIKVFCDKGAERKTRDEERRAAKRRMAATTRKKYEDLYHQPCDRSEFYSMSDLTKPPVLFTPAEDLDKVPMELQGFYSHDSENGTGCSVGVAGAVGVECSPPSNLSPQHGFPTTPGRCMSPPHSLDPTPPAPTLVPPPPQTSSILSSTSSITQLAPLQVPPPTAVSPKANSSSYKFHYSFPQPYGDSRKELGGALANGSLDSPMPDVFSHVSKRSRLTPPLSERLMLYVRQDGEDVYTPLHLVPPSTVGLLSAIEEKYKIPMQSIKNIYRKNKVGVVAKVDDDMLRHYCNEDLFMMEVQHRDAESFDLTLIELTGVEH